MVIKITNDTNFDVWYATPEVLAEVKKNEEILDDRFSEEEILESQAEDTCCNREYLERKMKELCAS